MLAVMQKLSFVAKEDKKINGQYTFVSHDAVTSAVREECIRNGLILYQTVTAHAQEGNTTAVDVEVSIVNVDNPEDRITIKSFGYGVDTQDKGPGKAMSYAYKYALLKAFSLETGDDPERDSVERTAKPIVGYQPAGRVVK